jgi:signal transduction histidine kinase
VARIQIFTREKDVVREIRDEGQGLPFRTTETDKFGVGIRSMQERRRRFGGSLEIEKSTGGTTVRALLPRGIFTRRGPEANRLNETHGLIVLPVPLSS